MNIWISGASEQNVPYVHQLFRIFIITIVTKSNTIWEAAIH